jgi:outer membrane cobalamin receptor
MTTAQALARLLEGTGLKFEFVNASAVRVVSARGSGNASSADQLQRTASAENDPASQTIVVTGTRLSGVRDKYSPVLATTREEMDRQGLATIVDVLAALPQNFGGGASADTTRGGTTAGPGATSVNLRGLPASSTLTLFNSRRIAPSGQNGEYVDISVFPTAALDRVEVLTDGASSIYGSDAIAGVVNVILKRRMSGAETRVRGALSTYGDGAEYTLSQSAGIDRPSFGGILSYEHYTADNINSSERPFSRSAPRPNDLTPRIRRDSLYGSGTLDISPDANLSADAFYSDRRSRQTTTISDSSGSNSFIQPAKQKEYGASLSGEATLFTGWAANASAAYSKSKFDSTIHFLPASGTIFDAANSVATFDASANGPLFSIGGNIVRMAVGGQYRREHYNGQQVDLPTGSRLSGNKRSRGTYAAYGELNLPFFGPPNARPGLEELSVNGSVRYDHYSDFGSTTNPKVSARWSPVRGLAFRASYDTSFRAPRLQQLVDAVDFAFIVDYQDPRAGPAPVTALYVGGTSTDLEPETAKSWNLGVDISPVAVPKLKLRATYFDTKFDNQIDTPFPSFNSSFVFIDFPGALVLNPSPAEVQALANASAAPLLNFSFLGRTIDDVSVILRAFPQNLSKTRVRGIDAELSHSWGKEVKWQVQGNVAYLIQFKQQFSATSPSISILDRFGEPLDLRARAAITRSSGSTAITLVGNYAGSYRDNSGSMGRIGSWTTFDATLQHHFARGLWLTAGVRNILNTRPPRIEAVNIGSSSRPFGYDTANADPFGRMVSLLLRKEW